MFQIFSPFGEEGCMTKKDACSKHHKWIPSLRGSTELEQACIFQKLFELVHEKQKMAIQEDWATNALSILLHREPGFFLMFLAVNQKITLQKFPILSSFKLFWTQ